jgi:hypothetical protein
MPPTPSSLDWGVLHPDRHQNLTHGWNRVQGGTGAKYLRNSKGTKKDGVGSETAEHRGLPMSHEIEAIYTLPCVPGSSSLDSFC